MEQTETKPKRFLTTRQLSERWGGIHPRTVARWRVAGKIPAPIKMPGSCYDLYAEDEIEAHERGLVTNARS
jgi:hypothetical protein